MLHLSHIFYNQGMEALKLYPGGRCSRLGKLRDWILGAGHRGVSSGFKKGLTPYDVEMRVPIGRTSGE